MRNLSLLFLGSLVVGGCKSEKQEAPTGAPKPVETAAPAPAPSPPPADEAPGLTPAEEAKMARDSDPDDDKVKAALIAEAHADHAKERDAQGIPAAEEAVKELAAGTYDLEMKIDPSSALVYADFTATPPVARASCGAAPAELMTLAKQVQLTNLWCQQLPTKLVRCMSSLNRPSGGSSAFDQIHFDFEIVMGEAQLRAFGKEHVAGTPAEREKTSAAQDAKIVALGKKACRDAHGP